MEKPPLTREQLREALNTAIRAGQIALENGANTARTEETVHRVGTALGADWMEVQVMPSAIIATAVSHGEHRTRIQRIVRGVVQLSRYSQVYSLVKRMEGGSLDCQETTEELERIAGQSRLYGFWPTVLAVGLGCAAFVILFGGGPAEFAVVLATAAAAQAFRHSLAFPSLGKYLTTALVAAFATGVAWRLSLALYLSQTVVAASLLLLVPGVLMVSSTADLFRGDILAGISRAVSALLTVTTGAAGVWAVLLAGGTELKVSIVSPSSIWLIFAMGTLAGGGFAVLFDVPRQQLPLAALVGGLGVVVRWVAVQGGLPLVAACFLAGAAIGLAAEGLAAWRRTTPSVFAIPGYIPLVPGVVAFRAVLAMVRENYTQGLDDLVKVGLILVAIAIGMGLVHALVTIREKPVV